MTTYYITCTNWDRFLEKILEQFTILAPMKVNEHLSLELLTKEDIGKIVYDQIRVTQPLRASFFLPKEKILGEGIPEVPKKRIILGCKACDLVSLDILDNVFQEGDFPDPSYIAKRENTILISTDCLEPEETCFCTAVENAPFPKKGFDLNLSLLSEGFVVDIGSDKGEELIAEYKNEFRIASEEQIAQQKRNRESTIQKVEKIHQEFAIEKAYRQVVREGYESEIWKEMSETCVECGACNNICPTCHCYLLDDISNRDNFIKVRNWDSCVHTGYARVAGGLNPRPHLWERFRNRYLCKFQYLEENFGILGCTGCGRCIEACQGKIDMREVLTRIATDKESAEGERREK